MIKFLIQTTLLLLLGWTIHSQAQTPDKVSEQIVLNGKPTITIKKNPASSPKAPDPFDALRNGKVIFVKSSSVFVGVSVIEEKLQKRPEFQQLGLMITRDELAADIILEVHHDVYTKYVYTAVDPKSNLVIAGGKLSSLGGTVAGKVAKRFVKQLKKART